MGLWELVLEEEQPEAEKVSVNLACVELCRRRTMLSVIHTHTPFPPWKVMTKGAPSRQRTTFLIQE